MDGNEGRQVSGDYDFTSAFMVLGVVLLIAGLLLGMAVSALLWWLT